MTSCACLAQDESVQSDDRISTEMIDAKWSMLALIWPFGCARAGTAAQDLPVVAKPTRQALLPASDCQIQKFLAAKLNILTHRQ